MKPAITTITWLIKIGSKEIILTEEESEQLKECMKRNITHIWLNNYMISIPHISYMEKQVEVKQPVPELPEMSEKEHQVARERIAEMKAKLKEKLTN